MRSALAMYTITTAFGIWTYVNWYTGAVEAVPAAAPQPQPAAAGEPQKLTLPVANFLFNPTELTIPAGTTITWVNQDGAPHTVTSDEKLFDSGTFGKGKEFSFTFDTEGSFPYFCELHGSAGGVDMAGTVSVVAAGAAPVPAAVAVPTPVPPTPQPTPPPVPVQPLGQPQGAAGFRDGVGRSDQLVIFVNDLPAAPAGRAYVAFLTDAQGGAALNVGPLQAGADGKGTLLFSAPGGENLLASYSRVVVSEEDAAAALDTPGGTPLLISALPEAAGTPIRELLVNGVGTPGSVGYLVGLRQESDTLLRFAQEIEQSRQAGDAAGIRLHAEHAYNLIVGPLGAGYGDLNGDGKVQNPGDGFGLLENGELVGYLKASAGAAQAASNAADATQAIKIHTAHVLVSVENVTGWAGEARDLALALSKAPDAAGAAVQVQELLALAQRIILGQDADGDGQVAPVRDEGGALTAYQHGQFIAGFGLFPPDGVAAPAPAVASGINTVEMRDFEFGPQTISVPAGATVTWTNVGAKQHSAKADDGSFDTQLYGAGESRSVTFDTPGTFAYFCELHGDEGGKGMAGTVIVGDTSAAPAPAAAETPAAAPAAAPAAPTLVEVAMRDYLYDPDPLIVKVGSTVTWVNQGEVPHSAKADDGSFDTALFDPGGAKSITFDTPGTFAYFCELHGGPGGAGMHSTITVEP
jgi:plastocyanin